MQRIDHATAQGGRFTEGNPQTGTPATVLTAKWANTVQEELAGLLEGSGVRLDPADDTQLLQLFRRLNRPSLGFGDFFAVEGSTVAGSVAACCQTDDGALVLARSGELLLFTGRHCRRLHRFETTFGNDVWIFTAGDRLAVVTITDYSKSIVTHHAEFVGGALGEMATSEYSLDELAAGVTFTNQVLSSVFDPACGQLLVALPGGMSVQGVRIVAINSMGYCHLAANPDSMAGPEWASFALNVKTGRLALAASTSGAQLMVGVAERADNGWLSASWKTSSTGLATVDSVRDSLRACGIVRSSWVPELDAVAVTCFTSSDTQSVALISADGRLLFAGPGPHDHYLQCAFSWGGATCFLGLTRDLSRLAIFTVSRTGWFKRMRDWAVSPERLEDALNKIQYAGNFPKTLVIAGESLVLVTLQGEVFAMTDPVYAPLMRSLCGDHLVPVALCSDGRRLAWDADAHSFWATTKLF